MISNMGKKEKGKPKGNFSETARNQTEQNVRQDKKYSKRKLQTNWAKYEEPDDDANPSGSRGLDFAQFSNSDQKEAGGSHFQFAQEKEWSDFPEKVSDYLKLDLNELSHEIMCVPLHERLRLDTTLFSSKQIEGFERDALLNRERIRLDHFKVIPKQTSLLACPAERKTPSPLEDELDRFIDSLEIPQPTGKPLNVWGDNPSNFLNLNTVNEELDLILSMPSPPTVEDGENQARAEMKMELTEDWLDSLLND